MAKTKDNETQLLIATGNPGKIREISELVSDFPFRVLGLSDMPGIKDVPETGATFRENARLKAMGYAIQSGRLTLADDSGLEVDALGGRPGVISARYGGDVDYDIKISLLLDELTQSGAIDRRARFTCYMAISDPTGKVVAESVGVCEGKIAFDPSGNEGFGYDPVFIPDGYDSTFGELGSEIKQEISHRARAFSQIIPYLRDFIAI